MPAPSQNEICLCGALRRATRTSTRLYDEWMKDSGLKVTQYSLLVHLDRAGALNITGLARAVDMERTAMGRNLNLLEHKGLIQTDDAGADQRTKMFTLTKAGRAMLKKAHPFWRRAQAEMRRKLKNKEFPALNAIVSAITGLDV